MNTSKTLDINCDLGESYGIYRTLSDESILPLITSANIACGFHAGDPATMRLTVERALEHQVAIGTHPGCRICKGLAEDVWTLRHGKHMTWWCIRLVRWMHLSGQAEGECIT